MAADENKGCDLLYAREDLLAFAPRRLTVLPDPAYAYLPGRAPHPIRSPEGHLHGREVEVRLTAEGPIGADQEDWRAGIDLYNRGFFWEAHERWEGLWHALGRRGDEAELLRALIQTAAAQIKALEGNRRGIELLAGKSAVVLGALARHRRRLLGLDLAAFLERRDAWFAARLAARPLDLAVFPFIELEEESR